MTSEAASGRGYLYSIIRQGEILEEVLAPLWEAIEEQKMLEKHIQELNEKYSELQAKLSAAQNEVHTLSDDYSDTAEELLKSLRKLFKDSRKYYCPKCGNKMSVCSRNYPAYDISYYLMCTCCSHREPFYDSTLQAYLAWFNKCNEDKK